MTTVDIVTELFCRIDDTMQAVVLAENAIRLQQARTTAQIRAVATITTADSRAVCEICAHVLRARRAYRASRRLGRREVGRKHAGARCSVDRIT